MLHITIVEVETKKVLLDQDATFIVSTALSPEMIDEETKKKGKKVFRNWDGEATADEIASMYETMLNTVFAVAAEHPELSAAMGEMFAHHGIAMLPKEPPKEEKKLIVPESKLHIVQ